MSYRVELSKTGRAGCSNGACKKADVKIQKGELRQGVLVQLKEYSSMKWRHWGCVTPTVLHNWWETAGEDLELIDGYDELPADAQEKVKRSLEQGHVDDEDWNGAGTFSKWDLGLQLTCSTGY
ncbi:PARP-type zinc finger-containing protein C2A9.07c [Cercospora zeina]